MHVRWLAHETRNAFRVPLVIKPNGNEHQNRICNHYHLKIHPLCIAYDLDQVEKKTKRTKVTNEESEKSSEVYRYL